MKARYYLGALDWNKMEHIAVDPESANDIAVVYSKRRGEYVVRTIRKGTGRKEATSEIGVQLLERVLELYMTKRPIAPMAVPVDLQARMSKKEKPPKEAMFQTYQSRMKKD